MNILTLLKTVRRDLLVERNIPDDCGGNFKYQKFCLWVVWFNAPHHCSLDYFSRGFIFADVNWTIFHADLFPQIGKF